MKKKIIYIVLAILMVFALSACRKDEDKNLQLESQNGSSFVLKYYSTSKKNFGDLYLTVEDEKLTGFYCIYNNSYELESYSFTVGGYKDKVTKGEVEEGSKTSKIEFTLDTPIELISEEDSEDSQYDTPVEHEFVFSVAFTAATIDGELADVKDSSLNFYIYPSEIIEFIRNKELLTREDAE